MLLLLKIFRTIGKKGKWSCGKINLIQMDNWITIQTFTLPSEAAILRARLEGEGIECFLQNEFTLQVQPFYSNAVGGVQLQVREKDLEAALEILKDGGYVTESKIDESKWLNAFDKFSARIPLL